MVLGIGLGVIILILALVVTFLLYRHRRARRNRKDSDGGAGLKGGREFSNLDSVDSHKRPQHALGHWETGRGLRSSGGKLVAVQEGEEPVDEDQGRERVHIFVSDAELADSTLRAVTASLALQPSLPSSPSIGVLDDSSSRLPKNSCGPLTPGGGVGPTLRPFTHHRKHSSGNLSFQSSLQLSRLASTVPPAEFFLSARNPSTTTPYQVPASHSDACEGDATGLGDAALYSAYAKLAQDICEVCWDSAFIRDSYYLGADREELLQFQCNFFDIDVLSLLLISSMQENESEVPLWPRGSSVGCGAASYGVNLGMCFEELEFGHDGGGALLGVGAVGSVYRAVHKVR